METDTETPAQEVEDADPFDDLFDEPTDDDLADIEGDGAQADQDSDAQAFAEEATTEEIISAKQEEADGRAKRLIGLKERLTWLEDRQEAVTQPEAGERERLRREVDALEHEVATDILAKPFWGVSDEGLAEQLAPADEEAVEALNGYRRAVERFREWELFTDSPQYRVAKRTKEAAERAMFEKVEAQRQIQREQQRRVATASWAAATEKQRERIEASRPRPKEPKEEAE